MVTNGSEKMVTKTNTVAKETKSIKDIARDGSEVVINGMALTQRTYFDANETDKSKSEKTKEVLVIQGSIDGKLGYYTTNAGTTIFKQIMEWLNDNGKDLAIGKPINNVEHKFTIEIVKSQKTNFTYPSIAELAQTIDVDNLFKD